MSCFAFPRWLIARIDRIRRQFLWSRTQNQKPIHLLNWRTVCLPIRNGGLGVPDLHLQNISLLLRWWWRLYDSQPKLWYTYAASIYTTRPNDPGPLFLSSNGSFFWKSIVKLKPIFHSSILHQINSGEQTSFWHDAWVGQPLSMDKYGSLRQQAITVRQAKNVFHQLIPGPFTVRHHQAYEMIQNFAFNPQPDRVIWRLSFSGCFSVKSIYKLLSQGGKTSSRSTSIWRARVMPSLSLFFFFLTSSRLLTQDVMLRRHIPLTSTGCLFCTQCPLENAMHLFFLCPFVSDIWIALSSHFGYTVLTLRDTSLLTYLASTPRDTDRCRSWRVTFITATYFVWRERNDRIFRNRSSTRGALITKILHESALSLAHC